VWAWSKKNREQKIGKGARLNAQGTTKTFLELFAGIEAGDQFKPKRGAKARATRAQMTWEIDALERSIQKLKELANG
jgi:hypothetical protein